MRKVSRAPLVALFLASASLPGCAGDPEPGARVWRKKCSACHGGDGAGGTRFAEGRPFADLTDGRWQHGGDLESIRRLVADGDPRSTMPPFAGTLTPEEIDAVAGYVLKLAARRTPEARP